MSQISLANQIQAGGDHYKVQPIQPWDFISTNALGFLEGNVIKYVCRHKAKGGLMDLQKAKHYLQKLIEQQEALLPQPPATDNPILVNALAKAAELALVPMEAPVPKVAIKTDRWVVLYYHHDQSRRTSPMHFYTMADSRKEAIEDFQHVFPKAAAVWTKKVKLFKEGAAAAQSEYWASRPKA